MKIDLGCFGMPSVYEPNSTGCGECQVKDRCRDAVLTTTRTLSAAGVPGLEPIIAKLRFDFVSTINISAQETTAVPKKLQARVERLRSRGFDAVARVTLQAGRNPFPQHKSKELHYAGELLLQEGGFEKSHLRETLQSKLGWSYSNSATQASQALAVLQALNLVRVTGKTVSLND